jgi:type VI secretion system protein ImpA
MTDLEALLRPVSEESRCGPDLDAAGDPAYVELGVAAEWKEAKYVGDQEVSPAVAPDWQQVKETGGTLLAVSKDLRIAKHYVAALAHTEGLSGFAAGVRLLHDLLERYWEGLHPALEGAEDDWRKNLVMELNAERGALGGLRAAPIAESRRVGRYTVSHIEVLDRAMPAAEGASAPTAELLREAVRDSDPAAASARLESCRQALADLKAIQAVFHRHQPSISPDFPLVEKLLRRAAELLGEALGAGSAAAASGEVAGEAPQAAGAPGTLRNRADARRMLESVSDFLERTEPSHPAPLLIRRAARLLDLNFIDIIRDIAPEAAGQIEHLGGIRRE